MSERRVPQLDGIRGLAILLVLYWHYLAAPSAKAAHGTFAWALFRAGELTWSGVDLFFVLSGFLIGGILVDARSSPRYFRAFYLRRALRILPLYGALCVVGTALMIAFAGPATRGFLGQPMPFHVYLLFLQDFWLAHHDWDAYMGITWSLAVEEQFYLVFPLIVRFVDRRSLPTVVAVLVAASCVGRAVAYLHFGSAWGTAAYVVVFCRADALMLGVLGALAVRNDTLRNVLAQRRGILNAAVAVLGAGVGVLLLKGWTMQTRPMSTVGYTWMALFYLCILLIAVLRPDGWWARVTTNRALRSLGRVAYCLYMVHASTFAVARHLLGASEGVLNLRAALLGLVMALAISELSWRAFESKLIAQGRRFAY